MSEVSELKTIRDLIRWAVSRFQEANLYFGHGTETAWDEAFALILHSLHLPHTMDPSFLDARLTVNEREKLHRLIQTRIDERIPVPYLTHEAWFAGLPFYVDERVLIPRSPLAESIANNFAPWIDIETVGSILDLCTGSGCIAIACALAYPGCSVDASDINEEALAVAKMNVLRHQVEDQVTLIHSDLFSAIPHKKYDLIISNPPYVDAEDMADLPAEYRHEPKLALAAGGDGLDVVTRILRDALPYLSDNGTLIVEVGNSEFALAEKYPMIPFIWLEFQNGGGGIFLLSAADLKKAQAELTDESQHVR